MAKFVVIKDILNVRNKPVLKDEHFIGSLKLGEEVDLLEEPIAGDTPEGTNDNMWLSDGFLRMVSRAGVALAGSYPAKKAVFLADDFNKQFFDPADKENEDKWKLSWAHVDLEIWRIWKEHKTKGEGVNIAIIDSGIKADHPDLKSAIIEAVYAPKDNGNTNDSSLGHGTKSAGVLIARGVKFVFGVAPSAKIFVVKRNDLSGQIQDSFNENALDLILKKDSIEKIDIISLSITCKPTQKLKDLFAECKKRKILIVVAAGNTSGQSEDTFPANDINCISVAALTKTHTRHADSGFNSLTKFIAPGEHILTTGVNASKDFHEKTSAATPFFAGLLALFISLRKRGLKNFTDETLLNIFFTESEIIKDQIDNNTLEWRLPIPVRIIEKL